MTQRHADLAAFAVMGDRLSQRQVDRICKQMERWKDSNRKELIRRYAETQESGEDPWKPIVYGGSGLTPAERMFAERAKDKGAALFRHGWPDFIMELPDKTIGVEVKQGDDGVRRNQARMFAALERLQLPVFVWNPDNPDKLTPWRKYKQLKNHA
jgi:hypothetical protein